MDRCALGVCASPNFHILIAAGVDHVGLYTSCQTQSDHDPAVGDARYTVVPQSLETHPSTYLKELRIKNFALISDQHVTFSPGLNVITGESGSGKSVLVEALGQVLGATTTQDCVRPPADAAVVEATFALAQHTAQAACQLLAGLGLPPRGLPAPSQATDLVVQREIAVTGGSARSRCWVNGSPTSVRVLRELGVLLADSNGQHAAMSLRDSATQLALLDRIAATSGLAVSLGVKVQQMRDIEEQLEQLRELADEQQRQRMQRLCDMVRKARLKPGEERSLRAQLRRMEARRSAVEQCGIVRMSISGGNAGSGGVLDAVRTIEAQLHSILAQEQSSQAQVSEAPEEDDEALEGEEEEEEEDEEEGGEAYMELALEKLSAAKEALAAAEGAVKAYGRKFQGSGAEHAAITDRLHKVERLLRQHDCRTSEQLLATASKTEQRLFQYYEMEGKQQAWEAQLVALRAAVLQDALQLSEMRRAAAGRLRAAVEQCLKDLAMSTSRFDVRICWEAAAQGAPASRSAVVPAEAAERLFEKGGIPYRLKSDGLDSVEFLLAAAPAEPLRPLSAVASGGESARVMLALKAAPAAVAEAKLQEGAGEGEVVSGLGVAPLLVLDELDSSIGSRLGAPVGRMLRRMTTPPTATNSQIIAITHLPQVACYGSQHLVVRKGQGEDGRAVTAIRALADTQERGQEVADMLGLGLEAAMELLEAAQDSHAPRPAKVQPDTIPAAPEARHHTPPTETSTSSPLAPPAAVNGTSSGPHTSAASAVTTSHITPNTPLAQGPAEHPEPADQPVLLEGSHAGGNGVVLAQR